MTNTNGKGVRSPTINRSSSYLHKEVQRCIAISALDTAYALPPMKKYDLEKKVFELYHGTGDDNNISYTSLCLEGKLQFKPLWEATDESASIKCHSEHLVMKQSIVRCDEKLIANVTLTPHSLSRATLKLNCKAMISSRTLFNSAMLGLKNMKKAYAYALAFCEPGPGMNFPSGTTERDLDIHVLRCMYKEMSKNTSREGSDCGDNSGGGEDDVSTTGNDDSNFDDEWIFPGWMAFKCFGPMAPAKYQISTLELGDWKGANKKESGRCHARQQQKMEGNITRDVEICRTNSRRGITFGASKKDLAVLAQNEADRQLCVNEQKAYGLTSLIRSVNQQISAGIQMLQIYKEGSDHFVEQRGEIIQLKQQLREYEKQLKMQLVVECETPDEVLEVLSLGRGVKRSNENITVRPTSP